MEKCYDKRGIKLPMAVYEIIKDENPEVGKHYFDLVCMRNRNGNRLFNIELIVNTDNTWDYNAVAYDEKTHTLALIKECINGVIIIDIQIISKEKLETMKELQNEDFEVENVFETASSNNLDEYIFLCGDLDTWKCPLLTTGQQTAVAREFVKLYEQIEDKYPSVLYHLLTDPAAKTHHQNYEGGLTEHNFKFACYMYAKLIEKFDAVNTANVLTSVVKIAVLHDLCKVGLYKWNETTKSYDYDYEKYKHHAATSLDRAQTTLGIELKQIERICILLHMGPWANTEDHCQLTEEDALFLGEKATDFCRIKNWNNRDNFDSMLKQIGWNTVESQIVLMAHWADMQACK